MKKFCKSKNKYCIYILFIVLLIALMLKLIISISKLMIHSNDVLDIFSNNKIIFNEVITELNNEEIFILEKQIVGYRLTTDNFKNHRYILDSSGKKYSKYTNTFDIINKLNIEDVSKYDDNVSFSFNSIAVLGMEIAYIQDYEKYMYGHSVYKIRNIEDNWYYVKLN